MVCAVSKDLHVKLDAKQILKYIDSLFVCSGGGRADFVQGVVSGQEILSAQQDLNKWLLSQV